MSRESKKLEKEFQSKLIQTLKKIFVGCIVTKLDSGYMQGIPDLLILHKNKWAALECKKNQNATKQPNQTYFIERMNEMSFAKFIYPENEEVVLNELKQLFGK